jgi:hypothetical protein
MAPRFLKLAGNSATNSDSLTGRAAFTQNAEFKDRRPKPKTM